MKVLHVFDTAGVGSLIAKALNEYPDVEVEVITREGNSRNKNSDYYGVITIPGSKYNFFLHLYWKMLIFRPDIIHIHAWKNGITLIRWLARLSFQSVKLVYHGHGTDIRELDPFNPEDFAVDRILVSTSDINYEGTILVTNPVDTDLFHPNEEKQPSSALFVRAYPIDKLDNAKSISREYHLDLEVIDRITTGRGIPYPEFAAKLRKKEYYLDLKGLTSKDVLSKSGLEALAAGCKVITDDGYLHEASPFDDPIPKIYQIYQDLLDE